MKRFVIVLLLLLAVPFAAFAGENDKEKYNEYLSSYDFSFFEDTLDDESYEYLEAIGADKFDFENIISMDFTDFLVVLKDMLSTSAKSPLKGCLAVIVYIVISALIRGMKLENESTLGDTFSTASALIVSVLLISGTGKTITLCAASLGVAGNFIYAFIPVFCAIVVVSGKGITAFSTGSMLLVMAQAVSFAASNIFMPVVNCFLALGICSGIRAELRLERLTSSLKTVLLWVISFVSGAFVSVLSIKTAVSARADMLGIRSARFVINSVVPVIGASISEGLLSIQSYSSLIKSSVGIVGIIAVAFVFLPAILEVALWRLTVTLCAVVSDVFGDSGISLVLSSFKDALLLANVILILSAVTTVISIGLLIAAGG